MHCEEVFCKDACPVDALVFDETTHAIRVIDENCTACLLCVEACPYGGITYAEDKGVVIKCDLCGGDPACASYCAPGAIRFRALDAPTWNVVKANAVESVKYLAQGLR